eukprot:TRINITY_DN12806_c0_g1_i1.p1 TRINITY_DN12806_c0_g1~~TRINITY_DN12806_c0_g1_i1.p1  ORF type:complete len:507 (+),score=120.90 TRINITY_DN12806_c0_g1_i1:318-1838(+)
MSDIWIAAREGDLNRIKYLVEVEDVDINKMNEYDAIPLFYACLCGHKEIVEYLLNQGAELDAETYAGWRCYYACLNSELRDILKNFKAKPRDFNPLIESFRSLFQDSQLYNDQNSVINTGNFSFPDVTFVIEGRELKAHRFLLSSSPFFEQNFKTIWKNKNRIFVNPRRKEGTQKEGENLAELARFEALESIVGYFYSNDVSLSMEYAPSFLYLCSRFKLWDLLARSECELGLKEQISDPSIFDKLNIFQISNRLEEKDKWRLAKRLIIPPPMKAEESSLVQNMRGLVRDIISFSTSSSPEESFYSDVTLVVHKSTEEDDPNRPPFVNFYSHKPLLCYRCEYFKPFISGSFQNRTDLIDFKEGYFSETIFEMLLEFLYTGSVVGIEDSEHLVDLMSVSNLLLLHDLKKLCVSAIMDNVNLKNVYDAALIGELYESTRLRDHCMQLIAVAWDLIVKSPALHDFIINRASKQLIQELKEALEDHLVHMWEKEKWLQIEAEWDNLFPKK